MLAEKVLEYYSLLKKYCTVVTVTSKNMCAFDDIKYG
jgi:hypothetical protein